MPIVPAGFTVTTYAELQAPRMMVYAPNGDLFVSSPAANTIVVLRDANNELWTPGAQSGNWYRWDGRQWIPGNPPERLVIPKLPAELAPEPDPTPQPLTQWTPPKDPNLKVCAKCGAENVGKKFCTKCGSKLA